MNYLFLGLSVVLGGFLWHLLYWKVIPFVRQFLFVQGIRKKYNAAKKEAKKQWEENREKGIFPEWQTIEYEGTTFYVDKKTGYCPANDSVVPKSYLEQEEQTDQIEEKYQAFKTEEMKKIAEKHGMTEENLNKAFQEILDIKLTFIKNEIEHLED